MILDADEVAILRRVGDCGNGYTLIETRQKLDDKRMDEKEDGGKKK